MSNKLFTSKESEEVITKVINLLELKNANFIIARLAIGITIALGQKVDLSADAEDANGKEFNNYTLFKNDGYDYYKVLSTLLADLYEKKFTDDELQGSTGLIKKHIDLGCKYLGDILESSSQNKLKFLKKINSLRFDARLADELVKKESPTTEVEVTSPLELNNESTNVFVSETISKIRRFLDGLGYSVLETDYSISSTVLRVKIKFPPLNKSIQEIKRRSEDLKLNLELNTDPIISVSNGYLCIDVPRKNREFVYLKDIIDRIEYKSNVTFPVGIDIDGEVVSLDLADSSTPHLLIGGATGQGKSELLKSIIITLATKNNPDSLELYLIDPKKVEFTKFKKLPTVVKVITEVADAINLLESLTLEMDNRYDLLNEYEVNNIDSYNKLSTQRKPQIVVIFDEFADFILDEKEIRQALERHIKKLSGKARAAGIHLILATQRPDAQIITGIIKANLPAKIAFKTTSGVNSKVIIDSPDAKDLLGKGDLLLVKESTNIRIQGAYIPEQELEDMLRKY